MICFSTEEEEAQVAITEINTYEGWRGELQKPVRKSREFERHKPDNNNKEHKQRKRQQNIN